MNTLVLNLLSHSSGHHSSHTSHTSHTSHINNVPKSQFVSTVVISSIILNNINNNPDEVLLIQNFRLSVENNYNDNKFNDNNYSFNILFYNETIENNFIKKCLFYNVTENNNLLNNFNLYSGNNIYYEYSYCKYYYTLLNWSNLILFILIISCCYTMCCFIDDKPKYTMY